MGETIRGAGFLKVDGILAALAENSEQLEHARGRFAKNPPSNRSSPSHNSTRSQSSDPASEGQHDQGQRLWQVREQYYASCPYRQFEVQKREELHRLYEADSNWTTRQPVGVDFHQLAEDNIKRQWKSQGIWNENWDVTTELWRWKHEESDTRIQAGATDATALFRRLYEGAGPTRTQSMSDATQRRRQRQRQQRQQWSESERDASRPFNQFIYQVFEERKRIHSISGSDLTGSNADIYTKAYDAIRNTWVRRGIWDKRWGTLPGMSWKHEQSLDDALREELGAEPKPSQVAASDIASRELVETSSTGIPGLVGSRANDDREPDASGQTTGVGGTSHGIANLFNGKGGQPPGAHLENGSFQRELDDMELSHGRDLRLPRTERSSLAPGRSGARRQKPDRRQQQRNIGRGSATAASPSLRRSKRIEKARNRVVGQTNNSGSIPEAARSRRRPTPGKLR